VGRLRRLDAELVRRGLARSRQHASELVTAGRVSVSGLVATKVATQLDAADPVVVTAADDGPGYVSRGAHKLVGALDAFPDIVVEGRRCLDAGASTGGFTDLLLRRGAGHVVAVDVGYGQLAWSVRQDGRVTVLDRTNVRELTPQQVAPAPGLVVADLSFISLRLVVRALAAAAAPGADLLLMVKPQFEVGRERLGSGGVVRDPALRAETVVAVGKAAGAAGLSALGAVASPLPGPSGNVEYFLRLVNAVDPPAQAPPLAVMVQAAVEAGPRGANRPASAGVGP
jgi:23S rRNA (cytidine1920-2'-O)/16S rRNA (cytidine1409-2'-O)-methyltransferase